MQVLPNKQGGRSMIEMLGVLAIIGLLSAGGVMGYSGAMETYKVNKTIESINNTAAQAVAFFQKHGSGAGTEGFSTANLCSLGIVGDVCKGKGFFGEKVEAKIWVHGNKAASTDYRIITEEGNLIMTCPCISIERRFISSIPVSACIKIMSSKAWLGWEEMVAVYLLGGSERNELPMSLAAAEEQCRLEMEGSSIDFRILIYLQNKGIIAE